MNPEDTHFTSSGLFWGWGWNLIWRPEDKRRGASLGLGSKWYELEMPNGTKSKYKNRVFSFGFVYNLAKR